MARPGGASKRMTMARSGSGRRSILGPAKPRGGIKAPRLPRALPQAELPRDLPADGETYSRLEYQRLDLAERVIARLHFEEVLFTQLHAAGSQLPFLRVEDVRFSGCNLANAEWPQASCARIQFIGCRMTGLTTVEALFHDTVFRVCKADLTRFYHARMRGVRFQDCPLTGADFRGAE